MQFRVSEKVKDRFLDDLKYFDTGRVRDINKLVHHTIFGRIFARLGLRKVDMENRKATKEKKDLNYLIKNVHLAVVGELPDGKRKDGSEAL